MLESRSGGQSLTNSAWVVRGLLLPRCCDSLIAVTLESFSIRYACQGLSGPAASGSTCPASCQTCSCSPFTPTPMTIGCEGRPGRIAGGEDRLLIGTNALFAKVE